MSEDDVEKWTQELRDAYEKGAKASEYFTSKKLISEFVKLIDVILNHTLEEDWRDILEAAKEEYEERSK